VLRRVEGGERASLIGDHEVWEELPGKRKFRLLEFDYP
jgi:hypothetical protein